MWKLVCMAYHDDFSEPQELLREIYGTKQTAQRAAWSLAGRLGFDAVKWK